MGTLHTVRYRQPQTQSTPGLSHNGLLLYVGFPGVSLPDGPVHGLLLWRPRWRILRLRLGRRIRSGIRGYGGMWGMPYGGYGLGLGMGYGYGLGLGLGVGIAPAIGVGMPFLGGIGKVAY